MSRFHPAVVNKPFYRGADNCVLFCNLSLCSFFFVGVNEMKHQFLPSKSKYLSKNKLGINITLFTRLIIDLKLLLPSYQYIFLSV